MESTETIFQSKNANNDSDYQSFLIQLKKDNQQRCRDAIFSDSSKRFYDSALAVLTNEPQPFSDLKSKVNAVTGLDDAWAILTGLVEAGLARMDEIDFTMSGANIKKNVKHSFQLIPQ